MPFPYTTPPVKMRLERSAERDKREIKNNSSAEYAQSETEGISNHLLEETGICSAAFCESAALGAGARSPLGELSRSD